MKHLEQIKRYLALLLAAFILGMVVGYMTARPFIRFSREYLATHSATMSKTGRRMLSSLITPVTQRQPNYPRNRELHKDAIFIFLHNTQVIALTLYGGTLLFFIPILQKILLGYGMGIALWVNTLGDTLKLLTPHGLVEFPLTFVVSAFAVWLGVRLLKARRGERRKTLVDNLKLATIIYLLSVPVLFIAAVLETYGRRLIWGA